MKKLLKWFLISSLTSMILSTTLTVLVIHFYINPKLKEIVEKKGSEALGGQITVDSASLSILPPFALEITNAKIQMPEPEIAGQIKRIRLVLGTSLQQIVGGGALGLVDLEIDAPVFRMKLKDSAGGEKTKNDSTHETNAPIPAVRLFRDIGIRVRLISGSLQAVLEGDKVITIDAKDIVTSFHAPSVNAMEADFQTRLLADVTRGELTLKVPVDLSTRAKIDDQRLILNQIKGEIFGIGLSGQGRQDLALGGGEWNLEANAPELAKLQIPPTFLPPGKWSGRISATIAAAATSRSSGWTARAKIELAKINGTTKWIKDDLEAEGSLMGNASADILFEARGKKNETGDTDYELRLNSGFAAADLSQMAISKKDVFNKAKGVPLVFSASGSGTAKSGKLEKLDFKFANLALRAAGDIKSEAGQSSSISIEVDRTDLSGWEAHFPPLAGAPVKGTLELKGKIGGDLHKPEMLAIVLKPLALENVEANLEWKSKDGLTTLKGPVKANSRAELSTIGSDLRSADLALNADLSGLAIVSRELNKKIGVPLTFGISGAQRGSQIEIKSALLKLGQSAVNVSGTVSSPQKPRVALKINTQGLQLAELASMSTRLEAMGLAGTAGGTMEITGIYDFKEGLEKSPLRAKGDLFARIPVYKMERAHPSPEPTPAPQKEQEKPAPLLPNWPIAQTAVVKVDVQIGEFAYGDLLAKGIKSVAQLANGNVQGSAEIRNVFSGSVKIPKFQTKLNTSLSDLTTDLEISHLDIQAAAAFVSPAWRELVKGSASGRMSAVIPHPSHPNFVERVVAGGTLNLKNGFVSTLQLDQVLNESLAKIPGIGAGNQLNSNGVAADISLDFKTEKKFLVIKKFGFVTPERNELTAQGKIGFDASIELIGEAALATAPVGGSIRAANSDKTGRFVVPLRIKGNLMKPEAAFAQETVNLLLKRTAEHEGKKKLDELQDNLKKKGVEGLKDLFR
jgi:hypothetical protein